VTSIHRAREGVLLLLWSCALWAALTACARHTEDRHDQPVHRIDVLLSQKVERVEAGLFGEVDDRRTDDDALGRAHGDTGDEPVRAVRIRWIRIRRRRLLDREAVRQLVVLDLGEGVEPVEVVLPELGLTRRRRADQAPVRVVVVLGVLDRLSALQP
jgi:hypothetical protein